MKDAVHAFYDALNRNDADALQRLLDLEVWRVEFEASSFRGIEAVLVHIEQGRGTWAEGACTPGRLQVNGEKVVIAVHVRVRLKDKTEWNEGQVSDGLTFRNGKVVEFHSFTTEAAALT